MGARETYPELVRMIRRLYDQLLAHGADYHHRTDPRVLMDVREFLVAVGELPAPAPEPETTTEASEADEPAAGEQGESE